MLRVASITSPIGTGLRIHAAAGVALVRVLDVLRRRVRGVLLGVLGRVRRARGRDGRV